MAKKLLHFEKLKGLWMLFSFKNFTWKTKHIAQVENKAQPFRRVKGVLRHLRLSILRNNNKLSEKSQLTSYLHVKYDQWLQNNVRVNLQFSSGSSLHDVDESNNRQ